MGLGAPAELARGGGDILTPADNVVAAVPQAQTAAHSLDTCLAAQFHRLRARCGDKRAAVEVGHSILTIVWYLLASPEAIFTALGGDYFLRKNPEREQRRAVRKLVALGFTFSLTPVVAAVAAQVATAPEGWLFRHHSPPGSCQFCVPRSQS